MNKASEGGGGKGIRKCTKEEDFASSYRQVCHTVSTIFLFMISTSIIPLPQKRMIRYYLKCMCL